MSKNERGRYIFCFNVVSVGGQTVLTFVNILEVFRCCKNVLSNYKVLTFLFQNILIINDHYGFVACLVNIAIIHLQPVFLMSLI